MSNPWLDEVAGLSPAAHHEYEEQSGTTAAAVVGSDGTYVGGTLGVDSQTNLLLGVGLNGVDERIDLPNPHQASDTGWTWVAAVRVAAFNGISSLLGEQSSSSPSRLLLRAGSSGFLDIDVDIEGDTAVLASDAITLGQLHLVTMSAVDADQALVHVRLWVDETLVLEDVDFPGPVAIPTRQLTVDARDGSGNNDLEMDVFATAMFRYGFTSTTAVGNLHASITAEEPVPGGLLWDGTQWVEAPTPRLYDGAAWQPAAATP